MRAAILGAVVLLVGGVASANAGGARSHFLSGLELYSQGKYAAALAEYQAAWVTWADPELLLDMAECNRHLGNFEEAREQYRGFLQRAPQSPLRASVERQLARLDVPEEDVPLPGELVVPVAPPPSASVAERGHPGRTAMAIGIAGWAASVLSGVLGVYTWSQASAMSSAAHADLVQLHSTNGFTGSPAEQAFFANPSCTPPSSLSYTDKYRSDCNAGQQFSTATTALLITSLIVGAGGTASFIVGAHQAARVRGVEVAPAITLREASLQLRFPF